MSRPKDGSKRKHMTLIEAMSQTATPGAAGKTDLPNWWKSDEPQAKSPTKPAASQSRPQPTATRQSPDQTPPPPSTPILSIRGSHVLISLSSVSAGLAAFCLCMVLGGAFLIGQKQGRTAGEAAGFEKGLAFVNADADQAITDARNAKPNPDIFDGLGIPPTSSTTDNAAALANPDNPNAAPTKPPFVAGHTYIVVQEFRADDQADALDAQKFLQNRGVETVILDSKGTYKYRLITLKGFNRADPDQKRWCDEFHERIRTIGKAYVDAGGRYALEGYQKTYTGPSGP